MYCSNCEKENSENSVGTPISTAKTNGLAIASLVLAILSFFTFLITSIPAIILGFVGLVKIRKSGGKVKGKDVAIAGIVLGFTIPIFMIPILLHVRQIAYRMICGTNMTLIGMEMLVYLNEYDDDFPTPSKWCDLLIKHTNAKPSLLHCKGATEGPCNYAMNKNIEKGSLKAPPDVVILFETHPGWNQSGGHEILTTDNHKGKGCNILFMDSHVEFVKTEELKDLKWEPE